MNFKINWQNYLIALIITLGYYALGILSILFVSYSLVQSGLVQHKNLLITATILSIIIVTLAWLYMRRKLKIANLQLSNSTNVSYFYVVALVVTFGHQYYIGHKSFKVFDYDFFDNWINLLSGLLIIPIIEELFFRDILLRIVSKMD
jgi:membrane protease YdiL (CAAX protease family)